MTMTTPPPAAPARHSLHVNGLAYAALVLLLFFGTLLIAQQVGFWSVSGKLTTEGAPVQLNGADPDEIKGWMTIQAVLDAYHVDQAAFYTHFSIPVTTPTSTALKDLEALAPAFSITTLRDWIIAAQ